MSDPSRRKLRTDDEWAKDVHFSSLEKEIEEKKEASMDAFRSLEESTSRFGKRKPDKRSKSFLIFYICYITALSLIIGILLYKFYYFLEDYEKVYQESLPYHQMDEFMTVFSAKDPGMILSSITETPDVSIFETDTNVENYIDYLLNEKEISYFEANDSTDKTPKYNITADGYIIGAASFAQKEEKRAHDLPIYELSNFEFYTDPSYSVYVKAPDTYSVLVNGVKVSPEYIVRIDVNKDEGFKEFVSLPTTKFYKVSDLYEKPKVSVITPSGEEFEPVLNTSTGIYEADYRVSEELKKEMLDYTTKSVDIYARVMSRELGSNALDDIFIKNHPFIKAIKSNASQFEWFPNHKTQSTDDTIREFIPYTENAFYVEIKHVQHTLKYGAIPTDIPLLAQIYYVKENDEWKICTINFIYE